MSGALTFVVLGGLLTGAACGRVSFDPVVDASNGSEAAAPCDLAAPFGIPIAMEELNTPANEGSFRLLPGELAGYFHASSNIFRAARSDLASAFTFTPVAALNTANLDQEPSVTEDDLLIVFRSRVAGNDELYYATRSSPEVAFDPPIQIASLAHINSDTQPFLSAADGQLYFQSTRDGADQDIYRSAWTGTTFAPPILIDELRANNEGDPALSIDGLTIYWRSTRPGGLGAGTYDIWT
ncbi:MAG: PD40 domain-containing protein, partial [Deltaproteobacteria bacterium]|nr:PD40 domain-containing protein [Deltaproteobacteria bacterium]